MISVTPATPDETGAAARCILFCGTAAKSHRGAAWAESDISSPIEIITSDLVALIPYPFIASPPKRDSEVSKHFHCYLAIDHSSIWDDAFEMPAPRLKPHPINDVFGMCVRLERTRRGLSQEELGQKIGRDQAFISEIESGKRTVTLDVIGRVADALEVRPADLLDEKFGRRPG
ncbi:helix-turn-helix domain-containing protein [Solimonas sp. K1W22B-7]|uniref:helix-turn-helix domain-containing protein n=1 Tax=Solimonas sp. K1W22B-7 TaxID=2303331 RepID=UPI00196986E9|nr:helix-turn-helix transcriptional regulator [Solimonas sp. K1W22B-7]